MRTMKYCPFCGNREIKYADDEVPQYAWCDCCKTWISAGSDFELHEVMYIVHKLKAIKKMTAVMKEAKQ